MKITYQNGNAYILEHNDRTYLVSKEVDLANAENADVIAYYTDGYALYRVLAGSLYGQYIMEQIIGNQFSG